MSNYPPEIIEKLTKREIEISLLILEGESTTAIAKKGAVNALQAVGRVATDETTAVGSVLDTAMRPAEKLIKQPFQAQVLYEESTKDSFIGDVNLEKVKNG